MWQAIKAMVTLSAKKYPGRVVLYSLMTIALILLGSAQPYIYKEIIDGLVFLFDKDTSNVSPSFSLAVLIAAWIVIAYSQTMILAFKDWLFWDGICNPTYIQYLSQYYQKILTLDYDFFIKKKSGALMKIFDNGIEAYSNLGVMFFEQLLIPWVSFLALFALAWTQSKPLTIALLILMPIHAGWSYYNFKKVHVVTQKKLTAWSKLFGHIGDVINNILTVKSFHQEKAEAINIDKLGKDALYFQHQENRVWALFDLFDINTIANATILIVGYQLIQANSVSLGTVLMFMSILSRLMVPILMIKNNIRTIQADGVKFQRLQNLVEKTPQITNIPNAHQQKNITGKIEFKKVSFCYNNSSKQALKNISLTIHAGEKVALVGHSGAGKSTFAQLLMRFYDVTKGSILLDDIDVKSWDYENFRSHYGVVWQENTLFHTSILNNIRYSKSTASVKDVEHAAMQAYAHNFIAALPKKYQSIVGERGVRLSGGEKQRIAIARALLKDPRIVILDEATSALDSITEKEVQKGILNLIKDRTAIIIAHRLSTVQHCDKIVVMDKGQVTAMGSHEELMKSSKQYRTMVQLQTHGFLAE